MVLIFAWTFQEITYLHFVAFSQTNKIGLKQTRHSLKISTQPLFQSLYINLTGKRCLPLTKEWTNFMTSPSTFFLFTDKIIRSHTYWIHSFKSRNFHKTNNWLNDFPHRFFWFTDKIIRSHTYWIHCLKSRNSHETNNGLKEFN